MKIKVICDSLRLKRTWVRVVEITGWGNIDKKRFLYHGGGPVPEEDKLPMAIANIQVALILVTIVLLALGIFSFLLINVVLGIVLLVLIFLPSYLAQIYFKNR